ncbi:AraC family transcriptional regulator [Paenibacillus sp. P26]|nr:AraC family transcriptional regulator [Paenibacillus sp. P26]
MEQAIRWLTLQYYQPISIEQMAQSLGYHRTHLSKMFKQHTGLSPMNFLLKIRMERAKLLLLEPLTIEQVASSVGFSDPLYFSKQFKKWYGRSPRNTARISSSTRTTAKLEQNSKNCRFRWNIMVYCRVSPGWGPLVPANTNRLTEGQPY